MEDFFVVADVDNLTRRMKVGGTHIESCRPSLEAAECPCVCVLCQWNLRVVKFNLHTCFMGPGTSIFRAAEIRFSNDSLLHNQVWRPFLQCKRSMNVSKRLMIDADITDFSELSFELRVSLILLAVRTGTVLEHKADAFDFAVQIFLISPQNVEPTRVSLPALRSGVLVSKHVFSYRYIVAALGASVSYSCHKIRVRDSGKTESDVTEPLYESIGTTST